MRTALIIVFLLGLAAPAVAATISVRKDGTGDFTVIQQALDVAAAGDTIRIGPGQFTEYGTYVYSGYDWHVYASVRMGSLTVIGAGENATLIGPDAPGTWGLGANAVGLLYWPPGTGDSLSVSELTFRDTNYGAYVQSGVFDFEQCAFLRVFRGVRPLASGVVRNCRFEGAADFGIAAVSPARSLTIDACSFLNCGATFSVQLIAAVTVSNCDVQSCYSTGIFDRSAGSMRDCVVRDMPATGYGLEVYGPGSYVIADNAFEGGGVNIIFAHGASNVLCERNVFSGSREEAVLITSCTPRLRNNHILKNGGVAVRVEGFPQPPDLTIDMTGNYWGTAIADSISAWIIDGNDPVVPPYLPIHGFVDFEPFSSVQVATEKASLGGTKARFR